MSLKMVSDRIVLLMFFYNKKRWKNIEHVQKRKKRGKNKGTFFTWMAKFDFWKCFVWNRSW